MANPVVLGGAAGALEGAIAAIANLVEAAGLTARATVKRIQLRVHALTAALGGSAAAIEGAALRRTHLALGASLTTATARRSPSG